MEISYIAKKVYTGLISLENNLNYTEAEYFIPHFPTILPFSVSVYTLGKFLLIYTRKGK